MTAYRVWANPGHWAFLEASEAVVETFKTVSDRTESPLIEHHWQYMYR